MTPEQKERYLKSPNTCPHCGSIELETMPMDYNGNYTKQKVECSDCLNAWVDVYQLISVDTVDE